ncbi:Chromatin structure remodeling complex protein sfh1 [Ceratobasidium sp. 423]|nr:Chromatin structure remodeling complex protein sfh1 [Ceratobasidium sp. 423]
MSSTLGARQWNPTYNPPPLSNAQALYTAYHSRARTGSTLLMQPLGLAPVPPNHNPTQPPPALTHAASFGPSRRTRGGVVNYAELEDDDDENIDVEGESSGPALVTPSGIPGISRASGELDRNYLGAIPPAKFIQPLKATRIHQEYFSEARLAEAASKRAIYVPIRLELNTDSHQIRDSFLWNVNAPVSVNIDDELDPMNDTDESKNQTSTGDDKQAPTPAPDLVGTSSKPEDKAPGTGEVDNHSDDTGSEVDSETEYETDSEVDEPDCRVIVNLDLQISTHHLHDHIEWDLSSSLTPEHFARVLCADTGLAGEAIPLVACALREALLKHTKDALEAGLIGPGAHDGRSDPLGTATRREVGSETLRSILRDWQDAEEYFPRLELLSAEELERRAMERERAIRRMRRETQRWGQANVSRKRFRER